jgi:hypothetical protein
MLYTCTWEVPGLKLVRQQMAMQWMEGIMARDGNTHMHVFTAKRIQ